MDTKKKEEIIRALNKKRVRLPCPRCGNSSFTLIDGYFNVLIQNDLNIFNISGPSVPSIVTACIKCGYLSQHALGALGLLPTNGQENKNDKKDK